jgi:exosortase
LLLAIYAPVLMRLAGQWEADEDMSHGFLVPLFAGYVAWQSWPSILAAPPRPSLWGLPLLFVAALFLLVAPPGVGTWSFLSRISFLISIAGLIVFIRGWATLRQTIYPLILLLMMIPIPGFIYSKITLPLQLLASRLGEFLIETAGYSVFREGNLLHMVGITLSVEEACSGLRSLLSLSFLGQAYVYLFDERPFMRWVMALAIVPIAILANAFRILGTGVLGRIDPALAHGAAHASSAWILFGVSFFALIGVHLLLNRFVFPRKKR